MSNKISFLFIALVLTFAACTNDTVAEQVEEEVIETVQEEQEVASEVASEVEAEDLEGLSTVEKDAIQAAKLICKTRGLSVRLVDGGEKAIKDLEAFQNENQYILREIFETYPIHTEEGPLFMDRLNFHLEKCEFNP
ncbi:MAG TPA: hypothetical protein VL021_00885 [Brumimicrobium sp.]|nr:hypothetical protein [Brumimicrobium sp.]